MRFLTAAVALIAVALSADRASAQKAELTGILQSGAAYVAQYSERLQAVVAEEDFVQLEVSGGRLRETRRLLSDVLFAGVGRGRVVCYRDVFIRDGNVLHEHEPRLLKLFQGTFADTLERAQQLTNDGARHHVSPTMRYLDEILSPLAVLRGEDQKQTTFKLDGVKTTDGRQVATLRFQESARPRVINSPIADPSSGRLIIDVATGTVRQTELVMSNGQVNLRATVVYALDPALALWLPSKMTVQTDTSALSAGNATTNTVGAYDVHESLEGSATYSKYQQAPVNFKVRSAHPARASAADPRSHRR